MEIGIDEQTSSWKALVLFFKENEKNIKNINCGYNSFILSSIDNPKIEEQINNKLSCFNDSNILCFSIDTARIIIHKILFRKFEKRVDNTYYIECVNNIMFEISLNS